MGKAGPGADLRRFMEKRLDIKLNLGRHVYGTLRGYDQFMNIVLDNAIEIVSSTEKNEIGMVVIRGNAIEMWECLDKVNARLMTATGGPPGTTMERRHRSECVARKNPGLESARAGLPK